MATLPRVFVKDQYYHVYNRGNHKEKIFFEQRDYERFLRKFKIYRGDCQVTVLSYCLMPNHYHFLMRQDTDESISKLISRLQNSHAKFLNLKYELVGSSFQNPFQAKLVDRDEYLLHLSRYIHLNPIDLIHEQLSAEGKLQWLIEYPWSSLKTYVSGEPDQVAEPSFILGYNFFKRDTEKYRTFITQGLTRLNISPIEHLIIES